MPVHLAEGLDGQPLIIGWEPAGAGGEAIRERGQDLLDQRSLWHVGGRGDHFAPEMVGMVGVHPHLQVGPVRRQSGHSHCSGEILGPGQDFQGGAVGDHDPAEAAGSEGLVDRPDPDPA